MILHGGAVVFVKLLLRLFCLKIVTVFIGHKSFAASLQQSIGLLLYLRGDKIKVELGF